MSECPFKRLLAIYLSSFSLYLKSDKEPSPQSFIGYYFVCATPYILHVIPSSTL